MSYYSFTDTFIPGQRARSGDVDRELQAIENAFDLLPADEDALTRGSAAYAGSTGGTGNAFTATPGDSRSADEDGDLIVFKADRANTGAATLEVDGNGARNLRRVDGQALAANDIQSGLIYTARYDATNTRWLLQNPSTSYLTAAAASASAAAASASSASSSASAASSSASAAASSATDAQSSEDEAEEWAINPEDDDISTSPGNYSALHWSAAAEAWATQAEDSPIKATFGGDGSTTFSAFHWAQKASAASGLPLSPTEGQTLYYDATTGAWLATSVIEIDDGLDSATINYGGATKLGFSGQGALLYSTTDDNPFFGFYQDDSTTRNAFIQASGAGTLRIRQEVHGQTITLDAEDNGGTVRNLFTGDPDNDVELYYAGSVALRTRSAGADIYRTTGSDTQLRLVTAAGAQVGIIESDGSVLNIGASDGLAGVTSDLSLTASGSVSETYLYANAGGSVDLYYDNVNTASTAALGFLVQNPSGVARLAINAPTSTDSDVVFQENGSTNVRAFADVSEGLFKLRVDNSFTGIWLEDGNSGNLARFDSTGDTELYASGSLAFTVGSSEVEAPNNLRLGGKLNIDRVGGASIDSESHGDNFRLRAEDAGGTLQNLLIGDPDDAVTLYYDGSLSFRTSLAGADVLDTDGTQPLLGIYGNTGGRLAYIQSNTSLNFVNQVHGGEIILSAENNSGALQSLFSGDPDAGTELYYAGTEAAATAEYGFDVFDTVSGEPEIRLKTSGGTTVGWIYRAGATFNIRAQADGDELYLRAQDSGSTLQTLFHGDPDGASELYHTGTKAFETTSAGALATGSQLQLQNTGASATRIQAWNTEGGFSLLADADTLQIRQTDASGSDEDTWINFANNGAVTLYFNNTAAFRTASHNNTDAISGASVLDRGGTFRPVGFLDAERAEITSSQDISSADNWGKTLRVNDTGGYTLTLNQQSTLPQDIMLTILNGYTGGGSAVTIAQGTGVTIRWYDGASIQTGNRTLSVGGVATIQKLTDSVYLIWGAGIS